MSAPKSEDNAQLNPNNQVTYARVLEAVLAAPDLTQTVRANLCAAVKRAAGLVSNTYLAAPVDIPTLGVALEKLTPAKLGFSSPASMAAFKSNLRRALGLAGITVMPGRHHAKLSGEWGALMALVADDKVRAGLSRFVRVAMAEGWPPGDVGPQHLERFRTIVDETCLKSKRLRMVRTTIQAWRRAQQSVPTWPPQDLEPTRQRSKRYALPWTELPASFKVSVDAFVTRGEAISIVDQDDERKPIRPATTRNYADGLRRAASILVIRGMDPTALTDIQDLLPVERVLTVLEFIRQRTGQTRGGHVGYMAGLLLDAAKSTPGLDVVHTAKLLRIWKKFRTERPTMAAKSFARLMQFDDDRNIEAVLALPGLVLERMKASREEDRPTRRTVRSALLLAILVDTALRSGNVCRLDLDRHFLTLEPGPRHPRAVIEIPGAEVKNGRGQTAELQPQTVRLLVRWLKDYRPKVTDVPNSWLFPSRDGKPISGPQACEDIVDLAGRMVGLDITPHLMRSLAGKIMLDANEGCYPAVQNLLGHGSLTTTIGFYTPVREQKVRRDYHVALQHGRRR